ncbi:MAG: hypothetical protein FJ121_00085 [Deltaproteobacteria bacterium]|nr:hypothetical protein [Deltaproteobacteria bacterium]
MVAKRWWWIVIGLGLLLALPMGPAWGKSPDAGVTITALKVELKVQSITKENFFMGEVWVSPAKFTDIQNGKYYVGYARAVGLDVFRVEYDLSPTWYSSDPTMVRVAPRSGHRVKLTVVKEGESFLMVTAGSFSKKLAIKSTYRGGAMYVEISQEIINPKPASTAR